MAMNKNRKTSNLANIVTYDAFGNVVLPAGLQVQGLTSGYVVSDANGVLSITGAPASVNIYNSNGTLTGNRTISTTSGYTLTINPNTTFNGNVYLNSANTYLLGGNDFKIYTGNTLRTTLYFDGGFFNAANNSTNGFWVDQLGTGVLFTVAQNSNPKFRVYNTGNVGIGGTTDAGYKLDVIGNLRVGGNGIWLQANAGFISVDANNYIRMPRQGGVTGGAIYSDQNLGWTYFTTTNNAYAGLLPGNATTTSGSFYVKELDLSFGVNYVGFISDLSFRTNNQATGESRLMVIPNNNTNAVGYALRPSLVVSGGKSGTWSGADTYAPSGHLYLNGGEAFTNTTNVAGGNVYINGGKGTGNSAPGDVIISTATSTVSGTTLQSLTNRWWIKGSSGILSNISSPNASAILQTDSTTQGFLPPRMTSTQKSAISSPATGLVIYQTDSSEGLYQYKSTGWEQVGASGTFVPTSRTLSINGTSYDLSANRTWSVGTVTSVGLTAGTGISVSGGPITSSGSISVTNTAPDQVVTLTNGGGMSITGTYPNFTLTATASVSGAPYYVPVFNGSGTGLTNSLIYDDTAHILIGTTSSSGSLFEASTTLTNDIATFSGVEPYIWIKALGASNGAALFFAPSAGVNGSIHNRTGGGIETYVGATPSIKHVVKASGQIQFNDYTSTGSFSGTVAGYLGFDSSGNIITTSGVGGITLTTTGSSGAATWDGTTLNIPIYSGGGGGSVTTVSVVSANGFAGTVANATSTPAITLRTTVSGILKGNGTSISAASSGLDYQAPITLTTTGSSGAATLIGNTLNIPNYTSTSINIYGSDGTLSGNRLMSSGGYTLTLEPATYFLDAISVQKTINNSFTSVFSNPSNGSNANSGIQILADASAGILSIRKNSSLSSVNPSGAIISNGSAGDIHITNSATTGNIKFFTYSASAGTIIGGMGVFPNQKVSIGTAVSGNSTLNIANLPTSSAGLVSGDVWRNGSVLNIVP